MGMRTVAVHSDADATLPFVREADAAIRIGPAPAAESYLAIDRVIAAAREAKADLVHPGYGFLAERPEFASAVDAAGMRFVGPPASVLQSLGDKAQAKAIAERAKVPVLPGYRGEDQSDDAFISAARSVGYPVMIKPNAGGGGMPLRARGVSQHPLSATSAFSSSAWSSGHVTSKCRCSPTTTGQLSRSA